MPDTDAEKWNAIYAAGGHTRVTPAKVLGEFAHLLPDTGTALDFACGRGANALFLAKSGLNVHAWDISEEAITSLKTKANELQLTLETRICDVTKEPLPPDSFDVVVVSYFLERKLMPSIINTLRKNGLLFYQTFIQERVDNTGPRNEDYRLGRNELLHLCRDLHIVFYREEGEIGNSQQGFRNEAMLIGQHR
jgi:2-polyprenyl-3-methyl-5-hydroxy-6-metoxy-1,4-benzoquinol methylase